MQCEKIIKYINHKLNDVNNVLFSLSTKKDALNEALQSLVSYRPDAASYTTMMLLAAGTKQTLPNDGVRLLKVIRNKGMSGLSDAGRAIRKADMLVQDALLPDWHTTTGQTVIEEYFYDPLLPKEFYVYPPAPVSPVIGIDISYVRVLPTITDITDTVPVDEYFVPAIQEWILYSLLCGDDEQSSNYAKSQGHLQTFFSLLQVKSNSDVASSPRAVKMG